MWNERRRRERAAGFVIAAEPRLNGLLIHPVRSISADRSRRVSRVDELTIFSDECINRRWAFISTSGARSFESSRSIGWTAGRKKKIKQSQIEARHFFFLPSRSDEYCSATTRVQQDDSFSLRQFGAAIKNLSTPGERGYGFAHSETVMKIVDWFANSSCKIRPRLPRARDDSHPLSTIVKLTDGWTINGKSVRVTEFFDLSGGIEFLIDLTKASNVPQIIPE